LTSYQAASALREGQLVEVLKRFVGDPIPAHLAHTGPPLVPLKLRAFLDFASPRLRASPVALSC